MTLHEKFRFSNIDELREKIASLGVELDLCEDIAPLFKRVKIGSFQAPNALAALPMEGCDSFADGSPSELVKRRYNRLSSGGAGLIWWEACAVVPEGRANPNQMMLTPENSKQFSETLEASMKLSSEALGAGNRCANILQLTHSGRYSRPNSHKPEPIMPQHDPILDPRVGASAEQELASDEYLDSLIGRYAASAKLAKEVGFDGIDIKACHRYLISELLASRERPGKYGGSFENRTRLLREAVLAVRREVGSDFIIACRFNVFDAHPYPYGFGQDASDMWTFNPEEPLALAKMLRGAGVKLLSNSAGNPYYIYPQVTRPFDLSSEGIPVPNEHPLESVSRLFSFTKKIQEAVLDVPMAGNGYTWLRQFFPYAGAANLKSGGCRFVGLGRLSFAYPEAPRDLMQTGRLNPLRCCIACSKCTQLMRDHERTGCVARDSKIYAPIYFAARKEAAERAGTCK
ncbi:MAG: NADH:flavin oxidoreductase [Clostridiales bacterium]|jgi:2,4-dienoyl-CoA reductase-like NADH-dependent reductase (Old Yellow Enzyme family)|nr:NADH:flavin oxidoreductase [Clostridiales bacterium]